MQVLVLTPENDYPGETTLVQHLLGQGLQRLHLRKPAYTREDYRRYLDRIDPAFHTRIVLHGHFDLLEEYALNGIHFNTAMRHDAALVARFAGYGKRSASFHTWKEITDEAMPYRYVFISPVFDSISKKGYEAAIDLDGAKAAKEIFSAQGKPAPLLMGLGGVSAENIGALSVHGFDGAVVLGSVWQSPDPVTTFAEIIKAADGGYHV